MCSENIEYFQSADEDSLRQLYYRSKQGFCQPGEQLFDVGDECEDIIVILNGCIDIVVSDGYKFQEILDVLGKDSIIGANFVLKQEVWAYEAVNNSNMTVKFMRINHNLISMLSTQNPDIMQSVQAYSEKIEVQGLP